MNFKDIIFLFLTGIILMYLIVVNINNIYKELSNLNHKPGIINIGE